MEENSIIVYTDGSCLGNPGPGGAGIVMSWGKFRKEISCFLGHATNNIAELMAIKIALEQIKRRDLPVYIYTDSTYAIGVLDGGYKAHKNKTIIKQIHELLEKFKKVELIKVAGHCGVKENELADSLASSAAGTKKDNLEEYEISPKGARKRLSTENGNHGQSIVI